MDFFEKVEDTNLECTQGNGNISDFNAEICRTIQDEESPCIFPFYWNGKLFENCAFLDEDNFPFPVFRCPIRKVLIKTKTYLGKS